MNKLILIFLICFSTNLHAQSSITEADSLYLHGNYTKAIEAYKKYKDSTVVLDKIAKAYMALGNYDAALQNYESSIAVNSENALLKYEYARLLAKTKKFQQASEMFYKLIDIDYRNPNYHYELGIVLEHLKDSTAQNRFYSAFQLDKTHQKAIFRIARLHVKKRRYKSANHYLDIGLSSYANNKDLISLKAQNYYNKKDYDNAVVWFEKLIALNESSQFIHERLRMSYAQIYEFKKAIEQGLLALEFDSKDANNLFIQGELYDRIDDFESAEKYMLLSLFIQDQPLDEEYSKLGYVYNRQKKYKEAIDIYKRAIEENPDNESAHLSLILTKNEYYKDVSTKIKLFENFKTKFPKSRNIKLVNHYIKALKEEQFLKTD